MKFRTTFLLIAAFLHCASAWFWPFKSSDPAVFEHENVNKLTDDTFEDRVLREDDRYYFVKFYAPWCGEESIGSLVEKHLTLQVRGYPEIKVFYKGRIGLAMRGGKDLKGMRAFVKEAIPKVRENHVKALEQDAEEAVEKAAREEARPGSTQEL